MQRSTSFCLLFVFGGFLIASENPPAGPITGLLVDAGSRSIRPILGMPGAAYAGSASVREMDFGVASPDGRSALVSRNGALFVVRRLDGKLPVWRQLGEEKPGGPAAFSRNGKALAILNEEQGRVDLWSDADEDPELAGSIDLTYLNETITALVVDDQARFAFAATRANGSGALYLLKAGEMPRLIHSVSKAGQMLLTADALYLTDRERSEILRITNWDLSLQMNLVATPGHGVSDPVGIALSADEKLLFVASAENRLLLQVDARSGEIKKSLPLEFTPTRLESLSAGAYLLLDNGVPGLSPAQIVDARTLQLYFVPVSALAD